MRGNRSRPIVESDVANFFHERNGNSWLVRRWAGIRRNLSAAGLSISIVGAVLVTALVASFMARLLLPVGFGFWSRSVSDGNITPGVVATAQMDFDERFSYAVSGTISAMWSAEMVGLAVVVLLIVGIERGILFLRMLRSQSGEKVSGFSAGVAQLVLTKKLYNLGNVRVARANKKDLVLSALKAIKAEIESLHPLHNGDVSNATFFLYQPDNEVELVARTSGVDGEGSRFRRELVVGHYGPLVGEPLTVYDYKRLPYEFSGLAAQRSVYRSILSIPCSRTAADDDSFIGFVTVDSANPFQFVGLREEVLNRIQCHITLLSMLYNENAESVSKREVA